MKVVHALIVAWKWRICVIIEQRVVRVVTGGHVLGDVEWQAARRGEERQRGEDGYKTKINSCCKSLLLRVPPLPSVSSKALDGSNLGLSPLPARQLFWPSVYCHYAQTTWNVLFCAQPDPLQPRLFSGTEALSRWRCCRCCEMPGELPSRSDA